MNLYLLFKSLHLISVISWMAGLLYLPRIFVYHAEATHESQKDIFKTMERKLYNYIMMPAMLLSWLFGVLLNHSLGFSVFAELWMQIKLVAVIILTYYHFTLGKYLNDFAIDNNYKEIHVKVFNTGKLEIPGIQTNEMFDITIKKLIETLQPFYDKPIYYYKDKLETVLVNSNFSCNFYLNREKLHNILKYDYKINSNFDPCSYPGIQCKYNIENQKISFMIFRTGSVLIVGKCEDDILYKIYDFLKTLFKNEYKKIFCNSAPNIKKINKIKKRKIIYINES